MNRLNANLTPEEDDMNERTWPETCCGEPGEVLHGWTTGPVLVDGKRVCTDGHALVATDAQGDEPPVESPAREKLAELMKVEPTRSHTYPMAALREWAGPVREPCTDCTPEDRDEGKCPGCDGHGKVGCECDDCGHEHWTDCWQCHGRGGPSCETCDLTGIVGEWKQRRGRVDGVAINRRVLARLLDGAPGDTVVVGRQERDTAPLIFVGEGWWGMLSPLRMFPENEHEWEGVPEALDMLAEATAS